MASNEESTIDTHESPISIAAQRFIQDNFRTMATDELAKCTLLTEDEVVQYICDYVNELQERGVTPDRDFVLSINLDSDNMVGCNIQWPKVDKLTPEKIDAISRTLFAANEGMLKLAIYEHMKEFAENQKAHNLVNMVLGKWSALIQEKEGKNEPLVAPHEVFGNGSK